MDLVGAADVVVSKPGYGIVTDCIGAATRLVYTDRGDFPEYEILVAGMPRYLPCAYVSNDDLRAGRLAGALGACARSTSRPPRTDGANVAAGRIRGALGSGGRERCLGLRRCGARASREPAQSPRNASPFIAYFLMSACVLAEELDVGARHVQRLAGGLARLLHLLLQLARVLLADLVRARRALLAGGLELVRIASPSACRPPPCSRTPPRPAACRTALSVSEAHADL